MGTNANADTDTRMKTNANTGAVKDPGKGAASSAPTLGDVMRAFKSILAIGVNRALGRAGRSMWQSNYSEHIIRE